MRVLFVCSGNAFRSPLAEALLKKHKPEIDADSAGINPAIPISEAVEEYLMREGARDHLKGWPQGLETKRLNEYDLIIAMKTKHKKAVLARCPECENKIVVWDIEDPYYLPRENAERIFEQIKQKVKELSDLL